MKEMKEWSESKKSEWFQKPFSPLHTNAHEHSLKTVRDKMKKNERMGAFKEGIESLTANPERREGQKCLISLRS